MISVCIASYNGAKYIELQIRSILPQLGKDDELVVSDDGSDDTTINIIASLSDSRIKVIPNCKKHGVVGNFENSISAASGDIIFLSDQDDIWMPNKIKKMVCALENHQFVVHNALLVDENGQSLDKDCFTLYNTKSGLVNNFLRNGLLGCCMAFRKAALSLILPFPRDILWHDMWIALILQTKHKVFLLDENLVLYRRHGNNFSTSSEKSKFSFFFKIKYRLIYLISIIKRYLFNV